MVEEEFKTYIAKHNLCAPSDRIVIAVSGGKDSMLMAYLFIQAGYSCILAHCNFHLRAEASDMDEALVVDFAKQYNTPCLVAHFDTELYAKTHKISTQMAARELRYRWFEEIRLEQHAQVIAVAQHQNDHVETLLLNLTRVTGLQGLQGILPKREKIIRPILFLSANEVAAAVQAAHIPYRDDQSNFSNKYARNKIRLEIIPKFKEIQPDFEEVLTRSISHFQESYALLNYFVNPLRKQLFQEEAKGQLRIDKIALAAYLPVQGLLFELFKPYGFSAEVLDDLKRCWNQESGRLFESTTHKLLLDRESLWLAERVADSMESRTINLDDKLIAFGGYQFTLATTADCSVEPSSYSIKVDLARLQFPLLLRFWQEGDYFIPLGMQGKKKLSDFFIGQKLNLFEKAAVPILVNGNGEIIWLVGHRLDNRYKITEKTQKVFTLDYQ